jgi:8-oxo-dGTP pyrophosphatase MutT (NUDIX family)
MFTDGIRVLAGYQTKTQKLGGFGGKSLPGESRLETALRETVEELFGVIHVPSELMSKLPASQNFIEYPEYTCFVYNFDDLQTFIRRAGRYINSSPLYAVFPLTVWDLLQNRIFPESAEVGELYLIPTDCECKIKISRSFERDLMECGF